jgi:CMP-N-acetylneuraminic acid synthetase
MSKEAQISAAELEQSLQVEWKELMGRTAKAINEARAGAIIADSEEIVRQAMAQFRQKVYERAVQLAADKAAKAAFSPCAQRKDRLPGPQ